PPTPPAESSTLSLHDALPISEDTERLQALARARRRLIGVHFEYLVHGEVEKWKSSFCLGSGLRFGGHFFLSRADHLGLPAIDNLDRKSTRVNSSHLVISYAVF